MCHGVDEDAQIGSDGIMAGKVPGDDSEDKWGMETARTTRLVRMSWLVWSRRHRVSYVSFRGKRSSRPGTAEAGKSAEYRGTSE
jgi:hypothetical protein